MEILQAIFLKIFGDLMALFGGLLNFSVEQLLFFFGLSFLFIFWFYFGRNFVKEGINYEPFAASSFANAAKQLRGNRWSTNGWLKGHFGETKKRVMKLDNFEFAKPQERKISYWYKKFVKKTGVYVEPVSLCNGLTMVAPMGSGKTVTMESFLAQNWYNRALINDEKAGDFVSKWFNKRKDTILNPFDSRSKVWDVLSESLEVVEFFIQNIINACVGDQQNFFSNDAKERYKSIARLTYKIEDPREKWNYFIKEFEEMEALVEKEDVKSAKDVLSTMKQVIELLKLNQHQLNQGKASFTISDFLKTQNQAKLFMVNVDKYRSVLTPLFTAFTACFALVHASQKETKEDITFYLLDEYLSLKMNYEAKQTLHTKIRSKGGALVVALHYFPKQDQKTYDLLTSSTYAYMIFAVKNDETKKFFDSSVGERTYKVRNVIDKKVQEQEKSEKLLDWSELDKMTSEYKHVTYIPEKGALFVGKSDYIAKKEIHESFILDPRVEEFYDRLNADYLRKKEKSLENQNKITAEKLKKNNIKKENIK